MKKKKKKTERDEEVILMKKNSRKYIKLSSSIQSMRKSSNCCEYPKYTYLNRISCFSQKKIFFVFYCPFPLQIYFQVSIKYIYIYVHAYIINVIEVYSCRCFCLIQSTSDYVFSRVGFFLSFRSQLVRRD